MAAIATDQDDTERRARLRVCGLGSHRREAEIGAAARLRRHIRTLAAAADVATAIVVPDKPEPKSLLTRV